jgi:cytochrome c
MLSRDVGQLTSLFTLDWHGGVQEVRMKHTRQPAVPTIFVATATQWMQGRSHRLRLDVIYFTLGMMLVTLCSSAFAQDAAQGKQVFEQCVPCHSTDPKIAGFGPSLVGVVSRKAGTVPGFRYSNAMQKADFVWTENNLDQFLANPEGKLPGNHMPFSGMPSESDRKAVIAYLQTLK